MELFARPGWEKVMKPKRIRKIACTTREGLMIKEIKKIKHRRKR